MKHSKGKAAFLPTNRLQNGSARKLNCDLDQLSLEELCPKSSVCCWEARWEPRRTQTWAQDMSQDTAGAVVTWMAYLADELQSEAYCSSTARRLACRPCQGPCVCSGARLPGAAGPDMLQKWTESTPPANVRRLEGLCFIPMPHSLLLSEKGPAWLIVFAAVLM